MEIVRIGDFVFGAHASAVLLVAASMVALGAVVLVRERDSRVSVYYFVLALAVCVWLGCYAFCYAAPNREIAMRWARSAYLGISFIPATSYMFTVELLGRTNQTGGRAALLWTLGTFAFVGIAASGGVLDGIYTFPWGYYPLYSWTTGTAFMLFIAGGMVMTVLEWWWAYRRARSSVRRKQSRWFLAAFVLAPVAFVDFLPHYRIPIYPIGYLVAAGINTIMALAILRYHLVELTPAFAADKIIDTMADPMVVCDQRGEVQVANDAIEDVLGYDPERIEGHTLDELLGEYDSVRELLELGPTSELRDREVEFETADGDEVVVSISRNPIKGPENEDVGAVIIARDIRRRKKAEEALKRSRRRYQLAAEGAHDGLWDWDFHDGSVFYSERWKQMLGLEEEQLSNAPEEWLDRVHPNDRKSIEAAIEAVETGENPYMEVEYRIEHAEGGYRWMLCRGAVVRDDEGSIRRMAGSQTDITDRKQAEAQLRHDAFHDTLTEIPNRALFIKRLDSILSDDADETERPFGILFLDLDRFKTINDSLGHTTGDELLQRVTARIRECLRPGDTLARLGGDEFGVLLDGLSEREQARSVANRVRARLEEPFAVDGNRLYISASIGVAVSDGRYESPKELLRDADVAMYSAKRDKFKQVAVFDSDMESGIVGETHLESALRRALENDELALNYQPILDLRDSTPIGFEALARWEHPEYGPIPPNDFIPLAEEAGMVVPLGKWVLGEAADQMSAWLDDGIADSEQTMNVNLSAPEISSPRLVSELGRALRQSGLHGQNVQVEITERILITNPDDIAEMFDELDRMDVQICIDDFGTGYSSLSYLRRFRADSLKLDREFVQGIHRSEQDQEIVRAIMRLADNLGLYVVAEGIETPGQLEVLRELGIEVGQGFLWTEPLPAEQLEEWLADASTASNTIAHST